MKINFYFQNAYYKNVVVHFDLKGAAPKADFLLKVFKLIKSNGATGILLEWEDTFPFLGVLEENRATDAYSLEDVNKILKGASDIGLNVIPLVQTFGHLEWILKLDKFRKYRENDIFPQVICLADGEAVSLVKEAIKQVIEVHIRYGISFFHIGADEAFQYGVCAKDMQWFAKNRKSKEVLAAEHLKNIAEYVKSFNSEIKVLAWHDMIRNFSPTIIESTRLDTIIEPVVWDYSETLQQQNDLTWRQLAGTFQTVWGSSAFKGANTPSTQEISPIHYMRNNRQWLIHKKEYGLLFKEFRGLIITGWSRYDHFAVLSELLVSGIPSLVLNLQVAQGGFYAGEDIVLKKTAQAMSCSHSIVVDDPKSLIGYGVFTAIHSDIPHLSERLEKEVFADNSVRGWLGRMNIRHNYTQLWYFSTIAPLVKSLQADADITENKLRTLMGEIYSENTINEWIYEYLDPITEKIKALSKAVERLSRLRTFPRRSFKILRDI
uniref:beta-N-acetylhexosaminidase n=1 Tax=Syphacia muris TaxID=451379 RepID=A0A0N5AQ48_9BILA